MIVLFRYPNLIVYIPSCRRIFDKKFKQGLQKYEIKGRVISQQDYSEFIPHRTYGINNNIPIKQQHGQITVAWNTVVLNHCVGYFVC